MNKNGFIASSLLYGMLALFLIIMISTLSVFANNKLSMDKLKKKAFDSLYESAMMGDKKINLVTSGDGLYVDPVESGRYVFKGASVQNYICLDSNSSGYCASGNMFRVMAIESDGTIKLIKNEGINSNANFVWDPGYDTSISGVKDANSVDGTRWTGYSSNYCYFVSSSTSCMGCKSWGSATTTRDYNGSLITSMPRQAGGTAYALPTTEAYINTYLNTTYYNSLPSNVKNKVADHMFNIGPVEKASGQTLATDMAQEEAYKWNGKIGLMNISDYVKGSTNPACTCVYEYSNTSACYSNSTTHNFLAKSYDQWTITPSSATNAIVVWYIQSTGLFQGGLAKYEFRVRPVLFLSSSVTLNGNGTSGNPYRISN